MKCLYVKFNRSAAFTLIELLIVVAIIAILAAIAVPNFLEAQTRAKVSRAKNDMRTIAVGLDSYQIDNNHYPYPKSFLIGGVYASWIQAFYELTTPVAFLSSVDMKDVFQPPNWGKSSWGVNPLGFQDLSYKCLSYDGYIKDTHFIENKQGARGYMISSYGPDRKDAFLDWGVISGQPGTQDVNHKIVPFRSDYYYMLYDPTNGTVSAGDIPRYGGMIQGPAQ